jgi:hypothetical protein
LIGRGRAKAKKESAKDSGVQDSQAEQAQTNSNI